MNQTTPYRKDTKKSLNVQSPEFIPDSSFSSSNGENTLNNTSSLSEVYVT